MNSTAAAFGVLFLANPDLPVRLRRGGSLNPPDRSTLSGGNGAGYPDYPSRDTAPVVGG